MHCSRACLRDTVGSCPRARYRSSQAAFRPGSGRRRWSGHIESRSARRCHHPASTCRTRGYVARCPSPRPASSAVTARAARSATTAIPIVYAVVVHPARDELAGPSGDPLANMTGVTTFDDGQAAAQIALAPPNQSRPCEDRVFVRRSRLRLPSQRNHARRAESRSARNRCTRQRA